MLLLVGYLQQINQKYSPQMSINQEINQIKGQASNIEITNESIELEAIRYLQLEVAPKIILDDSQQKYQQQQISLNSQGNSTFHMISAIDDSSNIIKSSLSGFSSEQPSSKNLSKVQQFYNIDLEKQQNRGFYKAHAFQRSISFQEEKSRALDKNYSYEIDVMQEQFEEYQNSMDGIPDDFPSECIGLLRSQWYNERNQIILYCYGTGFLVHSKILITCGHSVYSQNLNRKCDKVSFVPGVNGIIGNRKIYHSASENFLYFIKQDQSFSSKNQKNDEIAMIILKEPVKLQTFLRIQPKYYISGSQKIFVSGYPSKKYKSQRFLNKVNAKRSSLCGQTVEFERGDNKILYYNILTKIGHSGSPVLIKCDGYYAVIGVHRDIYRGSVNSALFFNETIITEIKKLSKNNCFYSIFGVDIQTIQIKQSLNGSEIVQSHLEQQKDDQIFYSSLNNRCKLKGTSYFASSISKIQFPQTPSNLLPSTPSDIVFPETPSAFFSPSASNQFFSSSMKSFQKSMANVHFEDEKVENLHFRSLFQQHSLQIEQNCKASISQDSNIDREMPVSAQQSSEQKSEQQIGDPHDLTDDNLHQTDNRQSKEKNIPEQEIWKKLLFQIKQSPRKNIKQQDKQNFAYSKLFKKEKKRLVVIDKLKKKYKQYIILSQKWY